MELIHTENAGDNFIIEVFDDWILKNINRVELDQIIGEED